MKKTILVVLTVTLLFFGATFLPVAANSGEELPDAPFPVQIEQG